MDSNIIQNFIQYCNHFHIYIYQDDLGIKQLRYHWESYSKHTISHEEAVNIHKKFIINTASNVMQNTESIRFLFSVFIDYCYAKNIKFHLNSIKGKNDFILEWYKYFNQKISNSTATNYMRLRINEEKRNIVFFRGDKPLEDELNFAAKHYATLPMTFKHREESQNILKDFWYKTFNKNIKHIDINLLNWKILLNLSDIVAQHLSKYSILITSNDYKLIQQTIMDIYNKYVDNIKPQILVHIIRIKYPEVCFLHDIYQDNYIKFIKYIQKDTQYLINKQHEFMRIQNYWAKSLDINISLDIAKNIFLTIRKNYPEIFKVYRTSYEIHTYLSYRQYYVPNNYDIEYSKIKQDWALLFNRDLTHIQINHILILLMRKTTNNILPKKYEFLEYCRKHLISFSYDIQGYRKFKQLYFNLFKLKINIAQAYICLNYFYSYDKLVTYSISKKNLIFLNHHKEKCPNQLILDKIQPLKLQNIWYELFLEDITEEQAYIKLETFRNTYLFKKYTASYDYSKLINYLQKHAIILTENSSGYHKLQTIWKTLFYQTITIKQAKTKLKTLKEKCFVCVRQEHSHNILEKYNQQEKIILFAEYCTNHGIYFSDSTQDCEKLQFEWEAFFGKKL